MPLTFETAEQLKEADTDYLKRHGVKRVGSREVCTASETKEGIEVCGGSATRYYFADKGPEELPSHRTCVTIPRQFFSQVKLAFDPPGEGGTPMTKEEIKQIGIATADEVVSRLRQQQEDIELRDMIIGCVVGEGAIPLHGRETRKAPCHGCRIDPSKPLEAGNVMATTEGAIGTLAPDEVRNWCSKLTEDPDGRCIRVRAIREAAKRCKELHPSDTKAFFECYAPAWAAVTKE